MTRDEKQYNLALQVLRCRMARHGEAYRLLHIARERRARRH